MIDQLRALGLGMTVYPSRRTEDEQGEPVTTRLYRMWTTDEAKATTARDLGAAVIHYESSDPTCSGWEISVTEVVR